MEIEEIVSEIKKLRKFRKIRFAPNMDFSTLYPNTMKTFIIDYPSLINPGAPKLDSDVYDRLQKMLNDVSRERKDYRSLWS
jgi:hypothetical protein